MDDSKGSHPDLKAMAAVYAVLEPLDQEARKRVLAWVASTFELTAPAQAHAPPAGNDKSTMKRREGTINTVSARLSVKSCRDLFVAAALHLTLFDGRERFSRAEWVARAKEAKTWKTDYSVQMATTITRLMNNGFVNEVAKDEYAVPDDQLQQHEARLGD